MEPMNQTDESNLVGEKPRITTELDQLGQQVLRNEELLEKLFGRLTPVMSFPSEENSAKDEGILPSNLSLLAVGLKETTKKLAQQHRVMSEIMARLDI